MEDLRKKNISIPSGTAADGFRESQQPRAELQFGVFDGSQIDFEADFVLFQGKTNHSPFLCEMFGLSHGQDGSVFQTRQQGGDAFLIAGTYENNLTALYFIELLQMLDPQRPVFDGLSVDALVERPVKFILAERAESQWSVRALESSWRPFRELREMKQKSRFNSVLARGIALRRNVAGEEHENQCYKNYLCEP
jgi:hypothetical protein